MNNDLQPWRWADDHQKSLKNDTLHRKDYAGSAANLIANSHSWDSSVVLGLSGPWGSGKSTLIDFITESLTENHGDWQIAHFTPWATSDTASMLSEFYAALSQALPDKQSKAFLQKAAKLTRVAAPALKLVPVFGATAAGYARLVNDHLTSNPPWQTAFNEAAQVLKDNQTRVLVVADDIDRLQTDELLCLLKVIRLLGRFPGVQYLLAYDQDTLIRSLRAANLVGTNRAAESFMEKIVQYPLTVPPLLEYQLLERVGTGIQQAFSDTGRPSPTLEQISEIAEFLRSRLVTPRAIDRFLAQLRHHLPMHEPGEINDVDVLMLTAVQVRFPGVYARLPEFRSILLSGYRDDDDPSSSYPEPQQADWKPRLLKGIPASDRDDVSRLLIRLFPKLDPTAFWLHQEVEPRQVSDKNYFDRYFAMTIPENDIPDAVLHDAITTTLQGDATALIDLLTHADDARAYLAQEKAAKTSLCHKNAERLLLIGALVTLPSHREALSLFDPNAQRLKWTARLLSEVDDTASPDSVLEATRSDDLYTTLNVLWKLEERLKQLRAEPPAWHEQVTTEVAAAASDRFIAHLKDHDTADLKENVQFLARFTQHFGHGPQLAVKIADTIASSDVTTADLAALFVILEPSGGHDDTSQDRNQFNVDLWEQLAPHTDDPFYDLPLAQGLDRDNDTWENRRLYAQGVAKHPAKRRFATE